MLIAGFKDLKARVRPDTQKPVIENFAFKLHYQLTVTLLLVFTFLVCAREYYGHHIKCIPDRSEGMQRVIESYCFFMATFTIVRHYNESMLQSGYLPHPGVGPISEKDEILQHKYYQWVPFVLFIQAIFFYMPHYIWKKKEGGRIKALVTGLQNAACALANTDLKVGGETVPSRATIDNKINVIRKDIVLRLRMSKTWSTWLVSMEVVNLINVMFQIWVTNRFLNGRFFDLGPRSLQLSHWNDIADPLEEVFPKVTKCTFHKFGPSGTIQQHDALCVMALNIIHEKIYTILWFWLLFVFIASVLGMIWRVASVFLYRRSVNFNRTVFRNINSHKFNPYDVIEVVYGCQFGDWLFLAYLAKNMNGVVFTRLFASLAEELMKRDSPGNEEKNGSRMSWEREPMLAGTVDYDNETATNNGKKSS